MTANGHTGPDEVPGALNGVVIVSGASAMRGIGRAAALRAAELGADVVVTDLTDDSARLRPDELRAGWRGLSSVVEEVETLGRRGALVACDLERRSEIEALVEVASGLGVIVGLVNAARALVGGDRSPLMELSDGDWDRTMAVNVRGPLTCSTLVAEQMIAAGTPGSIVNVSSLRATRPLAGKGAYCSSKAALEMVTRILAMELGPHGIRVNAVAPGTVATNRVNLVGQEAVARAGEDADAYLDVWLRERAAEVPLGRVATPDDVASAIGFLLGADSGYVSGECIQLSGGRAD